MIFVRPDESGTILWFTKTRVSPTNCLVCECLIFFDLCQSACKSVLAWRLHGESCSFREGAMNFISRSGHSNLSSGRRLKRVSIFWQVPQRFQCCLHESTWMPFDCWHSSY